MVTCLYVDVQPHISTYSDPGVSGARTKANQKEDNSGLDSCVRGPRLFNLGKNFNSPYQLPSITQVKMSKLNKRCSLDSLHLSMSLFSSLNYIYFDGGIKRTCAFHNLISIVCMRLPKHRHLLYSVIAQLPGVQSLMHC